LCGSAAKSCNWQGCACVSLLDVVILRCVMKDLKKNMNGIKGFFVGIPFIINVVEA
jgi:hypothetical protein